MATSDLLTKIRGTFNKPEFSDCVIHVEDKEFHVNKMILTMQSDVFSSYFRHDSKENQSGAIRIEESTPQLVEMMLRSMYGEDLENLDAEAYALYLLADRYNVVELKKLCVESMCSNLQVDDIFNYLKLAFRVNDKKFKSECLSFAAKHVDQFHERPEWIQLTDSEQQIARDVCLTSCLYFQDVRTELKRRRKDTSRDGQAADYLNQLGSHSLSELPRIRLKIRVFPAEEMEQDQQVDDQ